MEQKIDLLISHHQIRLRSKPYLNEEHQWGDGNLAQGFILHNGLIIADPLAEGSFGAFVTVKISQKFTADPNAQRAAILPFNVINPQGITLSSAFEETPIELPFETGMYTAYFEICVAEEIYYTFTLIKGIPQKAISLMDDAWGRHKDQIIESGNF